MQLIMWGLPRQESAQDKSQKYKEGKYILERAKLVFTYEGLTAACHADPALLESDCEEGLTA